MISGRRTDWGTPRWLFGQLDDEFHFTVDACADPHNHKLARYWTVEDDGLAQCWDGERVWCNPPYGHGIAPWVAKAHQTDGIVVMLLPSRTESRWWHRFVLEAAELRFVEGRVHFEPPADYVLPPGGLRPVFASVVAVFARGHHFSCSVSSIATPRIEIRKSQLSLLP